MCCFSAEHVALRSMSKDWLARNKNNVSQRSDMSIRGLLFQWASTSKIQLSVLVKNKVDLIIISLKINLFSSWYSWTIAEVALGNNRSLTQCVTNPVRKESYCDYDKWNISVVICDTDIS
jgi:hypothetical protein